MQKDDSEIKWDAKYLGCSQKDSLWVSVLASLLHGIHLFHTCPRLAPSFHSSFSPKTSSSRKGFLDHTYLNSRPSLFWVPFCFIPGWNNIKHLFTEIFISHLLHWFLHFHKVRDFVLSLFYPQALERCLIDSKWSITHLLIEYIVNIKWCSWSLEVIMIHLSTGGWHDQYWLWQTVESRGQEVELGGQI